MQNQDNFSLIKAAKSSKKYRSLDIPDDMLLDILQYESISHTSSKDLEKAFRKKLHNIVAPYLEDINYDNELKFIKDLSSNFDSIEIKQYCRVILSKHASTKERLPYLDELYQKLFEITGSPKSIIDLACGLHPFGIPWMNLDPSVLYYAYDIHKPRVEFINHLLALLGHEKLSYQQDILVTPPQVRADIAFFFKEAHRFEKRKPGCNFEFWKSLQVEWLIVSLPSTDLKHHHDLVNKHQSLIHDSIPNNFHQIHTILIGDEIFFFLKKYEI
ncbi:MAG: hypothetical protein MUO40_01640 [Anaerolineaceae bacterium]|nr:hypothetical protein [Anaerolineaceae bacterium]